MDGIITGIVAISMLLLGLHFVLGLIGFKKVVPNTLKRIGKKVIAVLRKLVKKLVLIIKLKLS